MRVLGTQYPTACLGKLAVVILLTFEGIRGNAAPFPRPVQPRERGSMHTVSEARVVTHHYSITQTLASTWYVPEISIPLTEALCDVERGRHGAARQSGRGAGLGAVKERGGHY